MAQSDRGWADVWHEACAYLSEASRVPFYTVAHSDKFAECSKLVFAACVSRPNIQQGYILAAGISKLRRSNTSKVRKRGARVARVRIFGG